MAPGKQLLRVKFTIAAVTALSFTLDLIAKNWARSTLIEGSREPFIPGILQFALTSNTGAAFSLGSGNTILMSALATLMTLALIVWAVKRELGTTPVHTLDRFGLGCLIGGALGNLFDRFTRGRVTDFLDFTFINFPVFNVSDVLINVGIGLLILSTLINKPERSSADGDATKS